MESTDALAAPTGPTAPKDSTQAGEARQQQGGSTPSLVIVIKDSQDSAEDSPGGDLSASAEAQGNIPTDAENISGQKGIDGGRIDNAPSPGQSNERGESETSSRKDSDLEITSVTSDAAEDAKTAKMWEAEDTLQCSFCKQAFVEQGSYLLHLMTHHDMTCKEHLPLHKTKLCYYNSRYQCYNCKLKTKHRVVFREHVRHHVLKLPYKCGVCLVELNSIQAFQNHLTKKVCSATRKNLVLKPTDIVRQVMKMLGPNAPATEHYYAVGKGSGASSTKQGTPLGRKNSGVPPGSKGSNIPTQDGRSSRSNSPPPPTASVTQLVSASNASSSSFIKVTRPVLTVISDSSTRPTTLTTTTTVTLAQSQVSATQGNLTSTTVEHTPHKDSDQRRHKSTEATPTDASGPQLDTSAEDGVLYIAESPSDTSFENQNGKSSADKLVPEKGTVAQDSGDAPSKQGEDAQNKVEASEVHEVAGGGQESSKPAASDPMTANQNTAIDQEGWTPVIIGCSTGQSSDDPSKTHTPTTEIIGGTAPSDAGTPIPDVQEEDGIRVINFSQSCSSSDAQTTSTTSESTGTSSFVGQSADHPILINDDDLHNATKGTQNKIKIEKKPNGIVLRLFRDLDGEMEDLSQLGLEIRDNSLFCYRCEKLFSSMTEFIPHVSTEIHKIFFFYAGQCPVCKLDADVPGSAPCKLSRILCRVLAFVIRNQTQPVRPVVQPKDENPATNVTQPSVSPARDQSQISILPMQGSSAVQSTDTPTSPVITPLQRSPVTSQKILIVSASPQNIAPRLPAVSSSTCIILQNQVLPGSVSQQAVQSVLTGQVNSPRILTGAVTQQGILTGSVNQQGLLTGSVNQQGLLTGSVNQQGVLTGMVNQQGILTASNQQAVLTGSFNQQAVLTGSVNQQAVLTGSVNQQAVVTGSVNQQAVVTGSVNEQAVVTGSVNQQAVLTGSVHQQAVLTGSVSQQRVILPVQQPGVVGMNQAPQILTSPVVLAPGTQLIAQSQQTRQAPSVVQGITGQQQAGLTTIMTSSSLPQAASIAPIAVQPPPVIASVPQLVAPTTQVLVASPRLAKPIASTAITGQPVVIASSSSAGEITVLTYKHTITPALVKTASSSTTTISTSSTNSVVTTSTTAGVSELETAVGKTTKTTAESSKDPDQSDKDLAQSTRNEPSKSKTPAHQVKDDVSNRGEILRAALPELSNQSESSSITSISRMIKTFTGTLPEVTRTGLSDEIYMGERSSNQTPVSVSTPGSAVVEEVGNGKVNGSESAISESCAEENGEDQAGSVDQGETGSSVSEASTAASTSVNGTTFKPPRSPRKLAAKHVAKPTANRRMFIGKFVCQNGNYRCLSCKFTTVSKNAFKIHISKHVHGKRPGVGSPHHCTHCPEHILYNKLGHCPVLKQTMKMLTEVAKSHPAWQLKIAEGPPTAPTSGTGNQHEKRKYTNRVSKSTGGRLMSSFEPSTFLSTEAAKQYPRAIAPKAAGAIPPSEPPDQEASSVRTAYQVNKHQLPDQEASSARTAYQANTGQLCDQEAKSLRTAYQVNTNQLPDQEASSLRTAYQVNKDQLPDQEACSVGTAYQVNTDQLCDQEAKSLRTAYQVNTDQLSDQEAKSLRTAYQGNTDQLSDQEAKSLRTAYQGNTDQLSDQEAKSLRTAYKENTEAPEVDVPVDEAEAVEEGESCQRITPYARRARPNHEPSQAKRLDKTETGTPLARPNFLLKCAFEGCDFKSTDEVSFKLHNLLKHPLEQVFTCAYCPKSFADLDGLIQHQDDHKGWVYKCSFHNCKFGARKIAEYQYHLREQHSNEYRFKCCFCTKVATAIEDILSHTELHVRTLTKCPYCEKVSTDKKDVQLHIAVQHLDKPKKVIISTQIIKNLEDLEELHRQENEAAAAAAIETRASETPPTMERAPQEPAMMPELVPQDVPMPQEGEAAPEEPQMADLLPPNIMVRSTEDRELSSPESPVAPNSPEEEPYEGYEPKKCEKCTFMATDEVMMDDHMALHEKTQDKDLRFFCRQCPFSSDELLDFRIHMQHHTGPQTLRVYICAHCVYSSMQMGKIEDHLMDVHPQESFKFEVSQERLEYLQLMKTCEICEEYVLSVSEEHMADHIQLYHAETSAPEEKVDKKPKKTADGLVIESFHCDMCPYSAPSDDDLTLHLKITHRVERAEREAAIKTSPEEILSASARIVNAVQSSRKKQALYECDLCNYKTANKKIFIDHHRQHAEGGTMDMYKCEFCPYQSAKYKNLTHHQKIHARQVEEGYKCPYCYYVHSLKSRVSWHISAYHPGREKNIVEITKGNPVPALIDDSSPIKASPSGAVVKPRQAAKKSTTKPAVNQPTASQPIPPATSKVYKQSSQVNYEYQGPYATTSAPMASSQLATSPNKQRPVSALPQYLEDDSLRDFERNLPKDMVFAHPVFCPLCSYSNRVRVNMLRHLKTHVKPKTLHEAPPTGQQTAAPVADEAEDPVEEPTAAALPKDFLSFFKRSTELTVFQCRLCPYVHVNGADMVRHFFCEHAVLACGLCEEHAISMERMREHYSAVHGGASLDVYLKRGAEIHKLQLAHIAKIDEMDKMTMLEEEAEVATASDEEEDVLNDDSSSHTDSETQAVIKHCTKVTVGNHLRYKCKMCDYLSSLQMIKRHVLSVHMRFFPFRCKYCKANSRERYHLQVHIKKLHPGRPIVMNRVKFDPEKHGKIVKTACLSNRKRRREDDSSSIGNDGSGSEHSHSLDRSSMERMTPSESVSSMDSTVPRGPSTPTLPATAIKQEPGVPPIPENATRRRSGSDLPRVHDLRENPEPPRSLMAGQQDPPPTPADGEKGKPRKKYCCAYCDYVSMYLKQDIQRHILLKHLLIHVFMCKKCKYATNNKKQIEQHKKQIKNHAYRDWTEIKDKIVDIHQEDMESVFGFPEGQLTEIQQQLDKVPGLYQYVNTTPTKKATPQGTTSSEPSTSAGSHVSSDVTQDSSSLSVNTSDYSQFTEFTRNAGLISPSSGVTPEKKHSMALATVKIQKKASEIKLPKMELFCCSYCDYSSKYGRGDVKKHIMFKHFMNKKYTCEYCGFSTWTEHIIKTHTESAHPNQPPNIYNFEVEHECIVPLRTTSDHHMMMGVKAPPNSPVELHKNTLFQCKLCNVEGPNIVKIKIHVVVKHWNMKPFQCPVCGDQRWKKQNVQDHITKEHAGCTEQPVATTNKKATELANLVKRRIVFSSQRAGKSAGVPSVTQADAAKKCCACEYVAVDQAGLNAHMSSHSVYSCIYCPFQALRKGDVQAHITKDHPEFPVRIKTSMPSATPGSQGDGPSAPKKPKQVGFSQPQNKKLVIGQKMPISQKMALAARRKKFDRLYECKECGHQVENYKNIIEHICKHINYFRFHCLHCTQRTLRAYTMTNHIEQHHPNTDGLYKIHKDEELEEKLKTGYTIVHKSSKNKECPASCPLCGKRCARLSTLREHIMREINYRPYLCPICDYCDCTGGRVNFHMRLHQGLSGSYKMKIDNQLAGEVQKLIDEAKQREEEGRPGPRPTASTSAKPVASAVSRFPKINLKLSPSPAKPQSRPPSVTSISSASAASSSRETSLEPAASTASEDSGTPKAHRCHLCPYGTNTEKLFKSHLMRTHGKKRWKCHYCDCQTVYRSTLIKHIKDTHRQMPMKLIQLLPAPKTPMKNIPDLQVLKTPEAFGVAEPQLTDLVPEGSTITVKTEKVAVRTIPVKSPKAQTRAPLPPNVQILGPSEDGRYLCSACPYSTTQRKLIGMHLNNHREPDMECFYCQRTYRVGYRLRRHSKVQHSNLPIRWKNLTSGEEFSVPCATVSATTTSAEADEGPQTLYCCHVCSFTTLTSDALFRHTQETHGSTEVSVDAGSNSSQNESSGTSQVDIGVLRCGVCSYSTSIAEELTEHAKTHLMQEPFHCQLCSYTCKVKADGLRHAARKHPHQKATVIMQSIETSATDEPPLIKRPRIVVEDLLELDEQDLLSFMKSRNVLRAHISQSRILEV